MDVTDLFDSCPLLTTRRQFVQILGVTAIAALSESTAIASTGRGIHIDAAAKPVAPAPSGLMCGLLGMPDRVEITDPQPTFSWIMNSSLPDDRQQAYQIRIQELSVLQKGEPLWDTGRIASDRSVSVRYAGKPLHSNSVYSWQVRTWDSNGRVSAWSAAQQFRTGELRPLTNQAPAVWPDRFTIPRYPIVQEVVSPRQIETVGENHYFMDFGRDAFAALKLTLDCSTACVLRVHMGEALDAARHINRAPGGSIRYHAVDVPIAAGHQSVTVPLTVKDRRMMPESVGPVMPFRYVEIENLPAEPRSAECVQLMAHYPFNDSDAHFSSSDPALDSVWELCRYTMKATSYCGVFVDGDRERHPYEADAYINQLGYYCATREYTLARYSHEYLIQHPTWPTEWIMHSVFMAWTDYLYTGDSSSLECFYDDLRAKTLYGLRRGDGLISTVDVPASVLAAIHGEGLKLRNIVDWPAGERDGYEMRAVNTVVNAFHYRAVILMSQIAAALGRENDAASYREAAMMTSDSFNAKLFDPSKGLYVDGEGSSHSALHANMFALAFGLTSPDRQKAVAEFVQSKGMACSVYGAQYLLEACYAAGLADHALDLLISAAKRGWVHMIRDAGITITPEAWDSAYKPNQDWNHAWGAAPANIIPRLLMGIEPIEPGYRKARIRPQPGALMHASITVPTVRGPITISLAQNRNRFVLDTNLPANMEAEIWLPIGATGTSITFVNGKQRAGRRSGSFIVIDGIGSGPHRMSVSDEALDYGSCWSSNRLSRHAEGEEPVRDLMSAER